MVVDVEGVASVVNQIEVMTPAHCATVGREE